MTKAEMQAEIERLKDKCDRQAMILRRLNPQKCPDTFFISGEAGERDDNGMPEMVFIVPAYGCDFHYIYRREGQFGCEW